MFDLAHPDTPLGPLEADRGVRYFIVKLLARAFESIRLWCTENPIVTRFRKSHRDPYGLQRADRDLLVSFQQFAKARLSTYKKAALVPCHKRCVVSSEYNRDPTESNRSGY